MTIALDGLSADQRRRLQWSGWVSLATFLLEGGLGALCDSTALAADALDFLAIAVTIGLSFWLVGKPAQLRAGALLVKAVVLAVLGVSVGLAALGAVFTRALPEPALMGATAFTALAANGTVLYLLRGERQSPGVLRSLWFATRNDMVGTAAVLIAAGVIAIVNNGVADFTVAGVMVVIFLMAAYRDLMAAVTEWEEVRTATGAHMPPAAETPHEDAP